MRWSAAKPPEAQPKAGANQLHGTGLDYYGTPMFRARDPFALQRPSGVSHSLGAAVNGPVALMYPETMQPWLDS